MAANQKIPTEEGASGFDGEFMLRDGRRMAYAEIGAADGAPAIYCHGFPASRLEARLVEAAARQIGVRLIAPDRPGYGRSDWHAERTILDWPDDVVQLADRLGLERFHVLGVSGGGPYALALAHRLPEQVRGLSIVCGLGQVCLPEALDPMHWPARLGFGTAESAPWVNRLVFGGVVGRLMQVRPEIALKMLTVGVTPPDRRVLSQPDIHAIVCESLREGLREGTRGALLDMALYARPWPFDPVGLQLPVSLWHGDSDATVPLCHTRMLAQSLPQATVHIVPGEGHFSLPIERAGEILAGLIRLEAKRS